MRTLPVSKALESETARAIFAPIYKDIPDGIGRAAGSIQQLEPRHPASAGGVELDDGLVVLVRLRLVAR